MCGEHTQPQADRNDPWGSSPHVRGTLDIVVAERYLPGIIPACAGNTRSACRSRHGIWDHPRMCGEHAFRLPAKRPCRGSSPHVRGTPGSTSLDSSFSGIIPACAGNTKRRQSWFSSRRDHPRMCGEHRFPASGLRIFGGSSQHVRGTLPVAAAPVSRPGIIPACAGNTQPNPSISCSCWDHPRMCGEHPRNGLPKSRHTGSSPHVRGTPRAFEQACAVVGIIPACAGNTNHCKARLGYSGDHPRMCGEHVWCMAWLAWCGGSSPHVRGTPVHVQSRALLHGIIPACAGNTDAAAVRWSALRDHPRMCGEHIGFMIAGVIAMGSSPHVRGTRHDTHDLRDASGIIPACAGNTVLNSRRSLLMRDHPRMCGEHCSNTAGSVFSGGSSPHVRGTPMLFLFWIAGSGIIPACAGNTCSAVWTGFAGRDHPRMCGEHL